MRRNLPIAVVLLAAVAGFAFSAVSAGDSIAHLDRQVHGIHCSYLPGLDQPDPTGSSGCYATFMSPYSSVFRESIWGGIPVAIPSMSVFAFLLFWASWMLIGKRQYDLKAAGFLFAATALPFLTSIAMAYISFVTLGVACKSCMGIYLASTAAFAGGAFSFYFAKHPEAPAQRNHKAGALAPGLSWGALTAAFGLGVLFVAVPFVAYSAIVPDFSQYVGSCGSLPYPFDPEKVLVPLGPQGRENEIVEVLDPLCVACDTFENRFKTMPLSKTSSRKVLLFPLDSSCNWMVDEAMHPGACTASEAVLCAGDNAEEVLHWIFEHREEITTAAKSNPDAAAGIILRRFPDLRQCLGSAQVQARLNLALRWAVKNQLLVLTPQIYVQGLRLCDEDTDIGLNYALPRLIARAKTLPPPKPPEPEPPRPLVPPVAASTDEEAGGTDTHPASLEKETSSLDAVLEQARLKAEEHAREAEQEQALPVGGDSLGKQEKRTDPDKQLETDPSDTPTSLPTLQPIVRPSAGIGAAPAGDSPENTQKDSPKGNETKPSDEPAPEAP